MSAKKLVERGRKVRGQRKGPVELRGRLQKWACALGATADSVLVVDAAQRIIHWNKGAEKLLGYSQAEVLKRPCYEVLAGKCCGKVWCCAGCKVQRWVLSGVLPDAFDLLTRTKGGKEIWVNVSTVVLPGGRNPLIAHLLRNVTQQKRTEEAVENLLGTLGLRDLPKSNHQGSNGAVQSLICQENKLQSLTRREVEVLSLLSQGSSPKDIASRLGVSPFTVRNHLQNSFPKLGAHSKAQVVSFSFKNGFGLVPLVPSSGHAENSHQLVRLHQKIGAVVLLPPISPIGSVSMAYGKFVFANRSEPKCGE